MSLTAEQVRQLLKPIASQRVMRANNHSHIAQQDVTAHLTRIFGFGNWSKKILDESVVIDEKVTWSGDGKTKEGWDVTYRVRMRLTIKDPDGVEIWEGDDGATGSATHQPSRADAHDLAYKAAISFALKRCAKDWGDQFGLSLYNGGQQTALVIDTLVKPEGETTRRDLQRGVPQQVVDEDGTVFEQQAQERAERQNQLVIESLYAKEMHGSVPGMQRNEGEPMPNSMFDQFAEADAAFAEEEGAPAPDAQKLAVFLEQVKIAANYAEVAETVSDAKAAAGVDAITPRGWELVRVAANLRREELKAAEQAVAS
jgi:recombination DNA repair RAD52 pathway protein